MSMMSSQVLRQRIVGWPAGFLWLGPDPLDWMEYICPGSAQVLIQLSVCCIKVCACLHICVQPCAGWRGWARVGCSRSGAPPFWLAPKTPFDVYACRRCMDLSVQWLFWFGCGSSVVFSSTRSRCSRPRLLIPNPLDKLKVTRKNLYV